MNTPHTIKIELDLENDTLEFESDKKGLIELKEMIERKIKLKSHINETLIVENQFQQPYKIRFNLR